MQDGGNSRALIRWVQMHDENNNYSCYLDNGDVYHTSWKQLMWSIYHGEI